MRLLVGLALLIFLFAILVRIMPGAWTLPLYILFVVLTIAFTGWERRRILQRRNQLQRDLHKERLDFGRRQKQSRGGDDASP